MRVLSRIAIFAALFCALTLVLRAQSVRPAIVEYQGAAEGQYEVVNDSLLPVFVTVEAKSFTIDEEGVAHFTRLDSSIHLQLSETSLRVPPHGHRTVFYKVRADSYPAWFCVYSTFHGLPHRGSMNMALDLPHTVYLLQGKESKSKDVVLGPLVRDEEDLHGPIRNLGSNVVRVESLEWWGADGKREETGGFPLLPGGTRMLHLPLRTIEIPVRLRAKLKHFSLDAPVSDGRSAR